MKNKRKQVFIVGIQLQKKEDIGVEVSVSQRHCVAIGIIKRFLSSTVVLRSLLPPHLGSQVTCLGREWISFNG
jgi:hypothetical protein